MRFSEKVGLSSEWNSEIVMEGGTKLNRHVQMKVAKRVMSNLDEEFWVM